MFLDPLQVPESQEKKFKIRSEMAKLEGFSRFPGKPEKIRENRYVF